MSPEQISAFQAAGQVKPAAVNLVILGLFSAFLLLWVVWVLNDAYRGVTTARVSWRALGSIAGRTILLLLVSFWLVLS
ncbi:TIGR03758 family integrating conjugative element protein [Lelliottia sp. CFBP8978]|uniref:TIGR03758 family integrating conjugative element protein n=1 Tax=Enterobacteriaceae TaxID=543 RepID=UPI002A209E10|nr:TIGR03758 family integrating conjugative element protein [Lelliottia sp. CFBP8978]EJB9095259.1 TIGR03758 family integrating conjugative element protein [Salmonella enterica]EJB9132419.1 TIGR03758 family integrating conjugative element protein [Salmonella enterica]EJC0270818.1 TIGR03758 family integrating conjugative element protein [Salmonella enterica]EJC0378873.1 TIGR03758 family integrating conjugative element protein [Salmonella enterica]EJC0498606.1 TIGR03758 family integrating conjuga